MSNSSAAQFIRPPNTLLKKVGGKMGKANPQAIARAEAAIAGMSEQFEDWLGDEFKKLQTAHGAVKANSMADEYGEAFFKASHDLKGLGTTYGYPLVSEMADSLCKMTMDKDLRLLVPLKILSAHVDAIRAVIHGKIKVADHPVGVALSKELRNRTEEFLAKHGRL